MHSLISIQFVPHKLILVQAVEPANASGQGEAYLLAFIYGLCYIIITPFKYRDVQDVI